MALIAVCPSCDEDVQLKGAPKIGQQVVCPHCEVTLEVIDTDPLELDWAELDDDWDDDDWDDEDDDDWDEESL